MPEILVFNTKTRSKEIFTPLDMRAVTVYHCGPTVYHFQHIGNMRRFIFADLVHRMLSANDYSVKQVINITDVGHLVSDQDEGEDKMEKGAKREGKSAQEIAEMYTKDFMEDLKLLHIRTDETIFPKATNNIPEQIEMIKTLEEKGFAYTTSDGVYFDTSKDTAYAEFGKLDLEGMRDGARVEKNIEKKNPSDFALWKFSPKDSEKRQQEWESPWGIGFPGWHIECSAMAKKFLGDTVDIHTGGIDHVTVHHTNEIAQSENANGLPLARYWMHNEHVNLGSGEMAQKMAKSGESFIRLKDLIAKGYHPLAYRYYTLLAHYQTKINFSFEGLDAAAVAWKRLNEFTAKMGETDNDSYCAREVITKATEALNDDLDTPKLIALIWEMMKDTTISDASKKTTILKIDEMIGIIDPDYRPEETISFDSLPEEVKALAVEREKAREEKDWKKADELRDKIKEKGFDIKDVAEKKAAFFRTRP